MMRGRAALVAVLLAGAATAAAAADEACPSAPWRRLPLATKPATLDQLDLNNWQDYVKKGLVPHLIGPAVAAAITLILLLSWLAWRVVKICCACCCACARGPQLQGKKARTLLSGKGARWLKVLALLASASVLAGSVYGIVQVDQKLVEPGLTAVSGLTGFVNNAVAAGHDTVTAVHNLDAALMDQSVRGNLADMAAALAPVDAAAAATLTSYVQAIDSTHAALAGFTSFGSDLDSIQDSTAGTIDARILEYRGTMGTADEWRAKGLYIAYGCVSGMAVFVCFGLLIDHPAWAKPWLLVLLIIVLLAWILNVVLTAVLRAGNDVCVNLEPKATELLGDSVSLGGAGGSTTTLLDYYLNGNGGTVLDVIKESMGIDVPAKLAEAEATLSQLQTAVSSNLALSSMSGSLDTVSDLFDAVKASVDELVTALSYEQFHPVYAACKGYVCCTMLNSVGDTWLGIVITCSFALVLIFFAFICIGRLDKLKQAGCCHIYSARDYTLEGSGGSDDGSDGGAQFARSKVDPLLAPPSPAAMARKDAQQPAFPPADGGIKASRVHPAPLYPAVGAYEDDMPPPAVAAFALPSVPSDVVLAAEAERVAALAGQAFNLASKAQHMLNEVARTTSRSQPGSPSGGYGAPAQPWAVAAPAEPALGAEASQRALATQSSQVFTGPCNVNYNYGNSPM